MALHHELTFQPLDKTTWNDFEKISGERGGCGGCWCMSWRLPTSQFVTQKGIGNKEAMQQLIAQGEQVGVLTYYNNEPIGWCAVAPREVYVKLNKSRVLKRIDDEPVWSITCLFLTQKLRRQGLSVAMLQGIIDHCKHKNAKIIEAYPVIPYAVNMPAAFAWTGFLASFERAGFVPVKSWSKARPIMRYYL